MVFLDWLLGSGLGPAAVAVPVNWAAGELASAAKHWFRRLRGTDDLSRLVRAATGTSIDLTKSEFDAVRRLLEDQQTWSLAGRGTVEDLAARIDSCLPSRDGRSAEDSRAAALTIARGLLEFAVANLDPTLFQQVLLTRLQRMKTDQASALDKALLGLGTDFKSVMDQLKLVLDQLPPGPAQQGEIVVYLRTLIAWLSTDPWPQDRRFGGPVLTPAAIERKLRVIAKGEQDLDADWLAKQCRRLVILGGPGSGKTWLAKRTARRCAEDALDALVAGGTLDEVELPVYTTCSRLFSADGDIRAAAVSSALDQLGDLGGSRISAAMRVFFTERNAPTVLVIDSLDEAHDSQERLRQADTLPWRIVLTSRPSSWNQQLAIGAGNDDSRRVGELQPLRYPDDVEAFIARWFDERPEWGNDLAAQIARRPDLRQAATVPLILAFYCVVGGGEPLPDFRHELYTRVLKRILTGRWRGSHERTADADTCLRTLRAWAWAGATNHPLSGIGTWDDDIPTERGRPGEADEDALDHVAAPLGPPNVDTGKTLRRFIHRSIREHFVAEHVASLPVDQAAEVLLPHLWYDPDWEYAAPTALARHPERDQLLRHVIRRATGSDQIPGDLSVIDAGWEFRGLLARVAAESSQADWSPEIAGMIGQARVRLARAGRIGDLGGAASWETSNRQARDALIELLPSQADSWVVGWVEIGLVQLAPTEQDMRQARDALLRLLARPSDGQVARRLAGVLAQLAPTEQDMRQARDALLRLLARQTDSWEAGQLAGVLAQLAPTEQDMRQARDVLLGLLARQTDGDPAGRLAGVLVQLAPTEQDRCQARDVLLGLLAGQTDGQVAERLASGVAGLAPTAEDKSQARQALLGLLAGQTRGWVAEPLVWVVARLDPTAEDKRQARQALLRLLVRQTQSREAEGLAAQVHEAGELMFVLARLEPTEQDKRQARQALLELLARPVNGWDAERLAGMVARLDPTEQDKRHVRHALLGLLAGQTDGQVAEQLASGVAGLATTAEDKSQARQALLGLLARSADGRVGSGLAGVVARLDPTEQDKRQARQALLGLLASPADGWIAGRLAGVLAELDPTEQDKRQARQALLGLLASPADGWGAEELADAVAGRATTAEDKRQARQALLELLASPADGREAEKLAGVLARLDPTEQDKRQARQALLGLLASQTDGRIAGRLAGLLAGLDPEEQDRRQARDTLAGLLTYETDSEMANRLMETIVQLGPTVRDLMTWRAWAAPPADALLYTARQNSALTAWLAALPSLSSLSD